MIRDPLSTSPNFDGPEAHRGIEKVLSLRRKYACLTHFGAFDDLAEIGAQLHHWIDRAEKWVKAAASGHESLPEMTARLETEWSTAFAEDAKARNLQFTSSALQIDIELNAQGLAFVADQMRGGAGKSAPK